MSDQNEHTYKLKYFLKAESGEFKKEIADKEGCGLTDALLVVSMLYPEDGSYSQTFFSFDGNNKGEDISDNDLFKMWICIASTLKGKSDLVKWKREFAETVFQSYREAIELS